MGVSAGGVQGEGVQGQGVENTAGIIENVAGQQGSVQQGQQGPGSKGVCSGVYAGQRVRLSEVERARGAAKQVLGRQRGNLVMWGALAELEVLVGNIKVGVVCFCMCVVCIVCLCECLCV